MINITLDDGRRLGIVPVAPHEAMTIAEGCRELSGVRAWWRTAMTVAAIRTIDEVPLPIPLHERHIEGLVARFSRNDLKLISQAEEAAVNETALHLELMELTPLESLRTWALIGGFEGLPGWVAPAFIAAQVRELDGEKVVFPKTKAEMKALVAKLGSAGMTQASLFMLSKAEAAKADDAEKRAAAKN